MPIVSESSSDPDVIVKVRRGTDAYTAVGTPNGRTRSQTGYRTRDLSQAEELGIKPYSWSGNVKSLISFYEEAGHSEFAKPDRAFVVNPRDYSEWRYTHAEPKVSALLGTSSTSYRLTSEGLISLTGVNASILPAWPSQSVITSSGDSLLRQSAPTKAEINLTRSLGELRDFPAMLRATKIPSFHSVAATAGQYLNMVFGLQPTLSDLKKTAETVVKAGPILGDYIRQERVRTRRQGTRILGSYSNSGVTGFFASGTAPVSLSFGPMSARVAYLVPGSPSGFDDVLKAQVAWSVAARRRLVTSSTYEYYIPQPSGVHGRLRRYVQLAERLAGSGLGADTIYDLTPYSWLVDWFVDVGGLISYQQNVVDNQLVSVRKSISVIEEISGSASLSHVDYDRNTIVGAWRLKEPIHLDSGGEATIRWKKLHREKGNPYSITPAWTGFSRQQWAILAAMGLSRSEGVPTIRGG